MAFRQRRCSSEEHGVISACAAIQQNHNQKLFGATSELVTTQPERGIRGSRVAGGEMFLHPVDDESAHFWGFLVSAIEELDAEILLVAMLAVERQ